MAEAGSNALAKGAQHTSLRARCGSARDALTGTRGAQGWSGC
jgi:hypothetical protein